MSGLWDVDPPTLYAVLPFSDVSLNDLYEPGVKNKKKGQLGGPKAKFLRKSTKARAYEKRAVPLLAEQWLLEARRLPRMMPYEFFLLILIHRSKFFNKTWPMAKHRFKKKDASNYIKLPEDVVSTVLGDGVDDRCNIDIHISKRPIDEDDDERFIIWLRPLVMVGAEEPNSTVEALMPPPYVPRIPMLGGDHDLCP